MYLQNIRLLRREEPVVLPGGTGMYWVKQPYVLLRTTGCFEPGDRTYQSEEKYAKDYFACFPG